MDVRDLRLLYDHRMSAVVDLAVNEVPAQLGREMIYCRIPLVDGEANSKELIETAIRIVATLVENGIRTVVACSAGMSRSPAIAAAAVAMMTKRSPDACLVEVVRGGPHDVSPGLWFAHQERLQSDRWGGTSHSKAGRVRTVGSSRTGVVGSVHFRKMFGRVGSGVMSTLRIWVNYLGGDPALSLFAPRRYALSRSESRHCQPQDYVLTKHELIAHWA